MEISIIILLIFLILFGILTFYLGFIRPPRVLAWLSQAAFITLTFILIPLCLIALWNQSKATDRLAKIGVVAHPSIKNSVGIATGIGTDPIWVFEVTASPEEIITFYRNELNTHGWTLIEDNPSMLIFKRGTQKLVISANESWTSQIVSYTLTDRDNKR